MAREQGRPRQLLGEDFHELGRLSAPLAWANVGYLGVSWAVVIGAFAVAAAYPHPLVVVLAILVVSSRQQAILNVYHDTVHGLLFPSRRLNDLVGVWLCASPCGSPFSAAKARHLAHHRLISTDEDPDAVLHRGDGFATRTKTLSHFAKGILGAYAAMVLLGNDGVDTTSTQEKRADLLHIALTQAALLGATALLFSWWVYPVVWVLPLATLTVFCHQLRSFVEHALVPNEEADHANRLISTRSNPLELLFVAPFNMNYHAEHHLFPWIPAPRLPVVQQRLDSNPEAPEMLRRPTYLGALARYLRSLPA